MRFKIPKKEKVPMKKSMSFFIALAAFLLAFQWIPSAEAMMFRCLNFSALSDASTTPGSMCIKVKVVSIQGSDVTVQILDVIKAGSDMNVAKGDTKVIHFPNQTGLRTLNLPTTPTFAPGAVEIWCLTMNAKGEYIPIGGWEQARFFIRDNNGVTEVYNAMGNSCLVDTTSTNSGMMKAIEGMRERNSGGFTEDEFKTLMNNK
jgi:hypothetical protein